MNKYDTSSNRSKPPIISTQAGGKKTLTKARGCLLLCVGCVGLILLGCLVGPLLLGLVLQGTMREPMVKEGYHTKANASLPLETKYTAFGPKEVKAIELESQHGYFKHYKIWYPSELETTAAEPHPIVVFANGTGVIYSRYEPVFRHLASWGFVAIGNDDPSSLTGKSTSLTLDFILSLNENPQSIFCRKLDTKRIGVTGHSQGGAGAVHAVTDFSNGRLFTSLYTASNASASTNASGKQSVWWYDTTKIRIPFFLVAATGQGDANMLAPLARLRDVYDKVPENVPAVMARRKNVDHGGTLTHADGYMTAWFCYTLMNDPEAKQVFAEKSPEIIENAANWQDVRIKNIK